MSAPLEDLPIELFALICSYFTYPSDRGSLINLACCSRACQSAALPALDECLPYLSSSTISHSLFATTENSTARLPRVKYLESEWIHDFAPGPQTGFTELLKQLPTLKALYLQIHPRQLEAALSLALPLSVGLDLSVGGEYGISLRYTRRTLHQLSRCLQLRTLTLELDPQNIRSWQKPLRRLITNANDTLDTIRLSMIIAAAVVKPVFIPTTSRSRGLRELYFEHGMQWDEMYPPMAQPVELCQWLLQGTVTLRLTSLQLKCVLQDSAIEWLASVPFPALRIFGTMKAGLLIVKLLDGLRLTELGLWHGMADGPQVALQLPTGLTSLSLLCHCDSTPNKHVSLLCDTETLQLIRNACPQLLALQVAISRSYGSELMVMSNWTLRKLTLELITPESVPNYACPCYTNGRVVMGTGSDDIAVALFEMMHTVLHLTAIDISLAHEMFEQIFAEPSAETEHAAYEFHLRSRYDDSGYANPLLECFGGLSDEANDVHLILLAALQHVSREIVVSCRMNDMQIIRIASAQFEEELSGEWELAAGLYVIGLLRSIWPSMKTPPLNEGNQWPSINEWEDIFTSMPLELISSLLEVAAQSHAAEESQGEHEDRAL